jgi:hypothetical protein
MMNDFNRIEEEGDRQEQMDVDHLVDSLLGWALQQVICRSHCNDPQDQHCLGENKELLKRDYEDNFQWNCRVARGRSEALVRQHSLLDDCMASKVHYIFELEEEKPRRRSRYKSNDRRSRRQ